MRAFCLWLGWQIVLLCFVIIYKSNWERNDKILLLNFSTSICFFDIFETIVAVILRIFFFFLGNIYNQVRDNPKEQRLYKKLKVLNNYQKSYGVEAILNKRLKDLRNKVGQWLIFIYSLFYFSTQTIVNSTLLFGRTPFSKTENFALLVSFPIKIITGVALGSRGWSITDPLPVKWWSSSIIHYSVDILLIWNNSWVFSHQHVNRSFESNVCPKSTKCCAKTYREF